MRLQWAILIVRHKVTKSTVADKAEWRRKSRRRTVEETAVAAAAGDKERNRAKVNHSRAYFYRCSVRCSCALLCVCVLACDENLSENISGMCWWCRSGNYAYTSNRDHRNRQQYNEHSIISCSGCQRRRRRRRRCRHPRLSPSNTAISEFYFIFSTNSWRMWYMSHVCVQKCPDTTNQFSAVWMDFREKCKFRVQFTSKSCGSFCSKCKTPLTLIRIIKM